MRYVIIRDDDTNALTPVSCLERLYRPFLERGIPVNLATIPEVALDTKLPDGKPAQSDLDIDFRQCSKATLLVIPDVYGRFRPRVTFDGKNL